jgi:hypothetical protein
LRYLTKKIHERFWEDQNRFLHRGSCKMVLFLFPFSLEKQRYIKIKETNKHKLFCQTYQCPVTNRNLMRTFSHNIRCRSRTLPISTFLGPPPQCGCCQAHLAGALQIKLIITKYYLFTHICTLSTHHGPQTF